MGHDSSHYRSSLLDGVFEVIEKETGGPAFPAEGGSDSGLHANPGMTLRDWFAGQIAAGLSSNTEETKSMRMINLKESVDATARVSYMIADALIRERSK
jgi:hypothetical protein